MEEKSRAQELSVREISLIRELAQIRKEHKRELEYEKFDGYELPPRTQFSMLNKPAVSIKYGVMKFNMACIRLFEGIKYVLPILHPNKKRLALIMCPEEDSASVEWARQKGENWVNKDITSLEFVENIFRLMNWNRECRYKVLGRVANSDQGLCMLFDLEEAIMFTPKPQEYADPLTGEMKKKQMKFFPDTYRNRIGKSYNDYIADHQMNMFEDFIGYQGSAVLDESEREADTTSVPMPRGEEFENIPLPDLPEQPVNMQQASYELDERNADMNSGRIMNLRVTIPAESRRMNVGKDVIRILGSPAYICVLQRKDRKSIAITPCAAEHPMSFKVPDRLLTDGQCRMMINGIQFIQVLLEANGLAAGKDHQFKGRYDAEKNAVIISLEKDEQSALSPQKCTT